MLSYIKKLYSEVIFPWGMDKAMSTPIHSQARSALLKPVGGRVLELGFGTGLNLPHYRDSVEGVWTADPNPGHGRLAAKRIEASPIAVEMAVLHGEKLPFEDSFFDFAVSTWTLCSIDDLTRALAEVRRVFEAGWETRVSGTRPER